MAGQDLHHGPHLHPPLLLGPAVDEVGVRDDVGDRRERVGGLPEAEQDGRVGVVGDDLAVLVRVALGLFDQPAVEVKR